MLAENYQDLYAMIGKNVKYDVEKAFDDKLTDKQYVIKNGGHINAETGYTKFEEILKEI